MSIERLAYERHIINNCEDVETSTDLRKRDDPMSSDEDETPSVDLEHPTTSSINPSVHSLVGSACAVSMGHDSPEDSLDTDLLSISSFSEDEELDHLDTDSSLFPIIKTVSDCLLVAFRGSATGDSSPCDGGESSGGKSGTHGTATHTLAGNINTSSGSSSKRNTDQSDDDGPHKPPPKKRKQNEDFQQKLFACPFWKLDPIKYRGCFSMTLRGIPRVKQHLTRKHTPTFYCQVCFVIFPDGKTLDRHVLRKCCTRDDFAPLEGISHEQQRELSRKSNPTLPEAAKWFTIWDIVFPRRQHPSSPYIDGRLSEDCSMFQEYTLHHGPELLAQAVEASEDLLIAELDEEVRSRALRQVLARGLETILERWDPPRASAPNASTGSSSRQNIGNSDSNLDTSEVAGGPTPAGSSADSGLGSRNNPSDRSSPNDPHPVEGVLRAHPSTSGGQRSNNAGEPLVETIAGSSWNNQPSNEWGTFDLPSSSDPVMGEGQDLGSLLPSDFDDLASYDCDQF